MSNVIQAAALQVVLTELTIFDQNPGNCLRVVREITQAAFGISYDQFYDAMIKRVEENLEGPPWARSMQLSLRTLGYSRLFEEREGGMLIFDAGLAKEGHVGVLVSPDLILENTASKRGVLISGYNRLSHISEWRQPNKLEVAAVPWASTQKLA